MLYYYQNMGHNMKRKYKIYIFVIGLLVALITIVLVSISKRSYYIVLEGENPIFMYEGGIYKEPGYSAFDSQGQDATGKVKMESNLNILREGEYKIVYTIENKAEITRNIIVKEIIPDDLSVDFTLNGKLIQDIKKDTSYVEYGYKAIGNNGKDYSKYVTIEGVVDVHKIGTYQIVYNLNVGSVHKKLSRVINITGSKYDLVLSSNYLTNRNVIISLYNTLKDFDYFINPLDIEVKMDKAEFIATKNGTYTFYMYDKKGNGEKIDVVISNIDKEPPKAKCVASVSGKNKTYNLEASDENGIYKYIYNGVEYTEPTFKTLNNNEDDVVSVYDKAGNVTKTLCEYKSVTKKGRIVANYNSSTLKYWIEEPNSTYAITHIWVKDGYKQIKTGVNEKIGVLENAKAIVNRELSKYNSKGMVAINASAFVMKSTNPLIKYNTEWKDSSNAPIIIASGETLRNFTNQSLPSTLYPVYGFKSNGYLASYNFDGGDNSIAKNQKTLEKMRSEGVIYTFSFNPILVVNNESKVSLTSKNIRQALCQIDRNNFIIISNINPVTRRIRGLSLKEVADIMVKSDCKYGVNLDGGGSLSLYYKTSSSPLKTIKSSNRKIADILYFVEQ